MERVTGSTTMSQSARHDTAPTSRALLSADSSRPGAAIDAVPGTAGRPAAGSTTAPAGPRTQRLLAALLLVTLTLKLLLVLLHGPAYDYRSDDRGYLQSAQIWLETGTFTYNDPTRPTVFITPGLPAMLAAVMAVTGPGLAAEQTFRVIQVLMMTGALWLLFAIGKRLLGERVALGGTALAAFYPPLWLVSCFIFTEAVFTLLLLALVWLGLWTVDRPSIARIVPFALVWAAATYVRPTIALWPGVLFLLLLATRQVPWRRLVPIGVAAGILFTACLAPWWVRNYEVSDGRFIPLTQSSGNPFRLGTYPFTVPAQFLDEQRTWHTTNDLQVNDALDTTEAVKRIKEGFQQQFWLYASWYTLGKFALFWGDVFYWMAIPGVPLVLAVFYHYLLLVPAGFAVWRLVRVNRGIGIVLSLLAYMSVVHMVYLAHSRYSVPLMPFVALFAAWTFARIKIRRRLPNASETV